MRRRRVVLAIVLAPVAAAIAVGCSAVLGIGDLPPVTSSADGAPAGDGASADAGHDATTAQDGGGGADATDGALPSDGSTPQDSGSSEDASDASCPVCTSGATQCVSATSVETCGPSAVCGTWGAPSACSEDAGVTPYVCERYGGAGCVDPNWAEWPMPNGAVDVSGNEANSGSPPAPNLEAYTDNHDGTVTDTVTGLMWQQTPTAEDGGTWPTFTWGSASTAGTAQNYCATLSLAGHADWRLPSQIELFSLVDPTVQSPSINAMYFPSTPASAFWSATPLAGSPGGAWYVVFDVGGADYFGGVSNASYVRCVR